MATVPKVEKSDRKKTQTSARQHTAKLKLPVARGRTDSTDPASSALLESTVLESTVTGRPAPPTESDAWLADRKRRLAVGLDWPVVFWFGVIHLGLLAAPFTFTWQALVLTLVLHWLTGGIGICLGYHRLFTHSSFCTYRPVRFLIAFVGGLAGEGSVIHWTANHRKHHALSDQVGDPHSPHSGPWWSHMLWFMPRIEDYDSYNHRWAPDLMKEPGLRFLDRTFLLWHVLMGAGLFAVGYFASGMTMAWSLVVWGMFVRMAFVMHATWLVNSATHMWGYRNYETTDQSRNNWWVALVTYGEGWHNNHHAYPTIAPAGHRWWEIDVTYLTIRLMKAVGLAWDVVEYDKKSKDNELA